MYSDTHNIADLTNEELYRMRDYGKFEYDREAAAAELARRAFAIMHGEQAAQPEAQPTPGPWQIGYNEALVVAVGPEPCIVADCATDCAVSAERARANAALIARALELAADNERLRGLLASLASAAERVLVILTARFQNDYRANGMTDEGALETAQGLTIITGLRETIEAAKEIRNA